MYRDVWTATYASVCFILFLDLNRHVRLGSGSGFKVGGKLITNNHVFQAPPSATHVVLQFFAQDGYTPVANPMCTVEEFKGRLLGGDHPENGWDYAIVNLDNVPELQAIPSLRLADQNELSIGSSVVLLGYQFGKFRLSMHAGIIASKFEKKLAAETVRYLQIDASVNQGNSGGPLVRPDTGEVVGIVTRKEPGFTDQFDQLRRVSQELLALYDLIVDTSPRDSTLRMVQSQLLVLLEEIERSANVGIGYAYEIEKVRNHLKLMEE